MAVIKRDVVLMGKDSDGDTTIDMPITRLGNIEDDAEIKAAPTTDDFIPIIDMADGGQMKKTPYVQTGGGAGTGGTEINRNFIDNPDFMINQRGEQQYDSSMTYYNNCCVDRWCLFSAAGRINTNRGKSTSDSYINYGGIGMSITGGTIRVGQYIDPDYVTMLEGQTVTVSAKPASYTTGAELDTISVSGTMSEANVISKTANNMTIKLAHDDIGYYVEFDFSAGSSGGLLLLKWVKLELGDTATPFVPPNRALELLKCQRWCQVLKKGRIARPLSVLTNTMFFKIPLPTAFRAVANDTIVQSGKGKFYVYQLNAESAAKVFTYEIKYYALYSENVSTSTTSMEITATCASHGQNDGVLTVVDAPIVFSCDLHK